MRTLKLTVAYDGTNYHGFQKQTNALTVQQVLEEKLSLLCGEKSLQPVLDVLIRVCMHGAGSVADNQR